MFERFTERARQVVVFAQDEARGLKHNYIGTEHLLLGLLREDKGVAHRVLSGFGVERDAVREQVREIIGPGEQAATGEVPFTPRAKKVLELSLREAMRLKHGYIAPEHILLGLMREKEGVAVRILVDFGAYAENVSAETERLLAGAGPAEPSVPRPFSPTYARPWSYHVVSGELSEDALNQLGLQGWELVALVPGDKPRAIFKRPA